MLALLAEARRDQRAGTWVGPQAPCFDTMIGIETRPRVAAFARAALQGEADVRTLDARDAGLPASNVVLLFDVLHLMKAADQERLLATVLESLRPGGVVVIREADAGAGWRFAVVRAGNRLKALAVGEWTQTFHFRTTTEWMACLERLGFSAEVRQMGQGTPFGNVLFRARSCRTVDTGFRGCADDAERAQSIRPS